MTPQVGAYSRNCRDGRHPTPTDEPCTGCDCFCHTRGGAYTVVPWMNTDPEGMRDGFAGHHPVTSHGDLRLSFAATEVGDHAETAADMAYRVGNRSGADTEGHTWPSDVRSLSVGDLLSVYCPDGRIVFLAVDSLGFTLVPEPSNPRVEFAGQGWVTSR